MRGATRGDGVRGEDVTSNVRTIRALPLTLPRRCRRRRSRCAARSTSAHGLRAHQPRARGRRASRCSRTRATPRPGRCGTSTRRRWPSAASRAWIYQVVAGAVGATPPTHDATLLRAARGVGPARSSRTGRAARASTRCSRSATSGARSGTRSLRDRRRRHQGGRPRAARAAGHDVEVPALGDRVQVPGAAGDDVLQADSR